MRHPDDAIGTVMCDAPIAIQSNHTPMSAAVGEVESRPKARGHGVVADWIGMTLARWGGARNQLGVHEVVHIFTVLAVLPGEALLDGPRGGEVGNAAVPERQDHELRFYMGQEKNSEVYDVKSNL